MAGRKNGNVAPKGDNSKAAMEASLVEMQECGRLAVVGKGAKQAAIDLFIRDRNSGLASANDVQAYVNAYCAGMVKAGGRALNGKGLEVFKSTLTAFADERVVKSYGQVSAALTALRNSKDKDVSRETTGKDAFGQLYSIANRIRKEGVPVAINADYIKASVAKAPVDTAKLAQTARESIADATKTLLGDKPNPKLVEARNAFFKLLKIELPA